MSDEITLQSLIDKIKTDLFSPYTGTEQMSKAIYPIFFIAGVELELAVNIKYDAKMGIKVTLPQVVGASLEAGNETGTVHTVKVKLSPILTRDELRQLMEKDSRLMAGVRKASLTALRKGSSLAGEEE